MKIINLEEFRKLPTGTIYMKYEPCVFGDLQCKGETWEVDYLTENITYWPKNDSSDDMADILFGAEANGDSVKLDFDCLGRDGCFNDEQLFAVYEKADVELLSDKLKRCIETAYK